MSVIKILAQQLARDLRHWSDEDLQAEIDYYARELLGDERKTPTWEWDTEHLRVCRAELDRRQRLPYPVRPAKDYTETFKRINALPIIDVFMMLLDTTVDGVPVKKSRENRWVFRCPLHTDRDPSGVVYVDSNTWWCFSCHGKSGRDFTVVDAIMSFRGHTLKEATSWAEYSFGLPPIHFTIQHPTPSEIRNEQS